MTKNFSAFAKARKYLSVKPVTGFPLILMITLLSACSSTPQYTNNSSKQKHSSISGKTARNSNAVFPSFDTHSTSRKGGGYYLDDGPGDNPPPDLHLIPDAEPKAEPLRLANMQPYVALGKNFKPMTALGPYKARGIASWYGRRYHGNNTASGTVPQSGRTIATWGGIPFGTQVYIPALGGIYTVEDRGGAVGYGIIDIYMDSEEACEAWGRQNIEIYFVE